MDRIEKCISEQAKCAEYIRGNPDGDVRGAKAGLADWMAEEAIERTSYEAFLESRRQFADGDGFDAGDLPSFLFPFQESLVRWALRKGRAAIFADCGLGKTPMFLVWADQIVRRTNGRVLIVCPLAVAPQIVREGEKFGVEVRRSSEGQLTGNIIVTNYERLHHFKPSDFVGMVADESSAIKSFNGVRRAEVTEFMRTLKYRLLCTATAAPNDYMELGTSSEALGELGHMDMLGRFFINDQNNSNTRTLQRRPIAYGGPKSTGWRFKGHAQEPFWKWVCSWARAVRRPSDLGFSDEGFALPPLIEREHVVEARTLAPGMLFAMAATNMQEEREERRRTLEERCEMAAELVTFHDRSVLWCQLNDEGDILERMIPNSLQVAGSDSDDYKEAVAEWFSGTRCICQESWFPAKLASWQNVPKGTGKSTTKTTESNASPTPCDTSESTAQRRKLTSRSGTERTKTRSMNTGNKTPTSEEKRRANDTQRTQPTESSKNRKSTSIESESLASDGQASSSVSDSPLMTTTECSKFNPGVAQYAEEGREINAQSASMLTTAIQPEKSADCSAQTATSQSESSRMTQPCSKNPQCTCGYRSGRRRLITKSKILGYGLNWQHCNHVVSFVSHSYEQYYQAVRRCWRFGQKLPVTVDLIASEGEVGVKENLKRKSDAADQMFTSLVAHVGDAMRIERMQNYEKQVEVPSWL